MSKKTSKQKGNRYENKIARILSKWIYGDPTILGKTRGSGSIKYAWRGDICPQKDLPELWKGYPFYIEAKHGYKHRVPTLYNFSIIQEWLTKAIHDQPENQPILFLVCKFHRQRGHLLFSNTYLNFECNIALNINSKLFYLYKLEELIIYNFFSIMDPEVIKPWISEV